MPMLGEFHARYPLVELDIELSERVTDLVAERFDVGFRVGQLRDASFVGRPLGPLKLVLCAAPAYLAATGTPLKVSDLSQHRGLSYALAGTNQATPWRLLTPSGVSEVPVTGPLRCNDFLALTEACCAGLGLAQLPLVAALPALRAGRLKVVLPQCSPRDLQLFMHYPDRQLPARVRVFVEFVALQMRSHPDLDTDPAEFAVTASSARGPSAATGKRAAKRLAAIDWARAKAAPVRPPTTSPSPAKRRR